jgi:2'-5' RNA ligase
MTDSLRTFIAIKIEPQPELLRLVKHLKKTFEKEKIKWVEENNLHLTLKFLGDTLPVQVEQAKELLLKTGENFSSFHFDLKGVGFFKRNRQPKVLFVNIENDEPLKQLASEIDSKLAKLGFEKEKRDFNPHLTLARIKYLTNKTRFYETVEEYGNQFIQQVKIDEIIYYQSILKIDGPEYKSLAKFGLNS